ncbi:MAG: hypothetical protein ABI862_19100 [Ilumatobacteraceae bacterium]
MRYRAGAIGMLVLLGGCFTGQRPSLTSEPFAARTSSGDAAIDQVLTQLDAVNTGPYTADYTVLTKFGNTTRPASVSVDADRRSVTVGNVRFLTTLDLEQTCILDKSDPCSSSIDPARISDTQITPDFYALDAAKRLRRSAIAKIGPTVTHREQIAGQSATCVDVPVPGGTSVFCALTNGPLARLDDGAVAINLTQYAPAADESLFTTSTQP